MINAMWFAANGLMALAVITVVGLSIRHLLTAYQQERRALWTSIRKTKAAQRLSNLLAALLLEIYLYWRWQDIACASGAIALLAVAIVY